MTKNTTIRVNHHPINYFIAFTFVAVILSLLFFGALLALPNTVKNSSQAAVFFFVYLLLLFGVPIALYCLIDAANAVVSVCEDRLHFRYLRSERDILFSDITRIVWTTYKENHGRGAYSQRIKLILTLRGEEENYDFEISDKCDTELLAECINGAPPENIAILKLYNILAAEMPDKACGFQRAD